MSAFDGFLVVGQALDQRGAAGGGDVETGLDQRRGINQQAGAGDFLEVAILQRAEGLGDADQTLGEVGVAAGFAEQDGDLALGAGKVEAHRDETLAGRGFQALEQVLVAGVVGNDEHEVGRRFQRFASAVDGQHAPVVGQRVEHDGGVLARLDHFVEIADAAFAHGAGQRAVAPVGALVGNQVAADEVGGGQVVVAGHGVQWELQFGRHVRDETRLADAGRAFDEQRQVVRQGVLEETISLPEGS